MSNLLEVYQNFQLNEDQSDSPFYIIQGDTQDDIRFKIQAHHGNDLSELCGSSLEKMTYIGHVKYAYLLIGMYHEYSLEDVLCDEVENDISVVIFADSKQQADQYLREHPALIEDIHDTMGNLTPDEYLQGGSAAECIFGDTLNTLAQLTGDFRKIPKAYYEFFANLRGQSS